MDTDPAVHLDPSLQPLRTGRRWHLLMAYALGTRRIQISVVAVALVVLFLGVVYSDSLRPPWTGPAATSGSSRPEDVPSWLNNIQAVFGGFTLLIAIFVWFDELRDDWEDQLPSRMSVFFFHGGRPAIVCRHVWLAGADDLRAWGQQVGAQAAGERFLDFSPDVAAPPPEIALMPDCTACRHHAVRFSLTRLPNALASDAGRCRYQNLLAGDTSVRSELVQAVEALPDVAAWLSQSPRT